MRWFEGRIHARPAIYERPFDSVNRPRPSGDGKGLLSAPGQYSHLFAFVIRHVCYRWLVRADDGHGEIGGAGWAGRGRAPANSILQVRVAFCKSIDGERFLDVANLPQHSAQVR